MLCIEEGFPLVGRYRAADGSKRESIGAPLSISVFKISLTVSKNLAFLKEQTSA